MDKETPQLLGAKVKSDVPVGGGGTPGLPTGR